MVDIKHIIFWTTPELHSPNQIWYNAIVVGREKKDTIARVYLKELSTNVHARIEKRALHSTWRSYVWSILCQRYIPETWSTLFSILLKSLKPKHKYVACMYVHGQDSMKKDWTADNSYELNTILYTLRWKKWVLFLHGKAGWYWY